MHNAHANRHNKTQDHINKKEATKVASRKE